MPDESTTIAQLKENVQLFCEARDWDMYHNAKDLAIGISTEASELLELFRFKEKDEVLSIITNPKSRALIGGELADVQYFLLRFSQMYGFDLSDELTHKLELNEKRYPLDKAKGSNRKYDELE